MTTTIQQTGKGWKLAMAMGVVLIVLGLLMAFGSAVVGAVVVVSGLALHVAARIGAWWCHG